MNIHKMKALSACMPMLLTVTAANAVPVDGGTLDPLTIPKYVTPLVIPPVMKATSIDPVTGEGVYDIGVRKFKQQILPGGQWNTITGRNDAFPPTTVFGYGPAGDRTPNSRSIGGAWNVAPAPNSQFNSPAYTIEATKDVKNTVDWTNQLVRRPDRCRAVGGTIGTEQALDCVHVPHLFRVDQTLHWSNPRARCDTGELRTDCHGTTTNKYNGPVPIVPHLHGAHTGSAGDGYTEAWWLPNASDISCVPRDANYDVPRIPRRTAQGTLEYVCEGSMANQLLNRQGEMVHNINNPVTGGQGVGRFGYKNDQPSSTLWFHDHALGITRLNVYAGPAGFYLIRDPLGVSGETGLISGNLPGPAPVAGEDLVTTNFPAALGGSREKYREVSIAIQGRSFNEDGSLFYPDNRAFFEGLNVAGTANTNPQFPGAGELQISFDEEGGLPSDIAPTWNPEAFFNTMVVNGTTWPQMEVAPSLYRFRLLNGTNSRFLNLTMPVVDPVSGLQTTVTKNIWYREINSNNGGYKGPWQQDQQPINELYMYQIGTEQSLLPQVTAIREGFATRLNHNPQAWAFEQAPYMEVNNRLIIGETAAPDPIQGVLMGPAERADIIVDFRGLPNGTTVRMINTAPDAPFGGFVPGDIADPDTTGQVMQFVVNTALLGTSPSDEQRSPNGALQNADTAATSPWDLQMGPVDGGTVGPADVVRELALLEEVSSLVCVEEILNPDGSFDWVQIPGVTPLPDETCPGFPAAFAMGPKAAVLGVVDDVAAQLATATLWSDPITTVVTPNTIEQWNFHNYSADAHPIHVHLVKYQVTNRIGADGVTPSIITTPNGVQAWENGWKDTVIAYPAETTSVVADFDITGLYVWHCHILEHEDHEMMVPMCVGTPGVDCPDKLF